jgi:hypothetical protein
MKILEAQSATLTNYEVFVHLKEQRARYAKGLKGRRPGNLETVVKEVGRFKRFMFAFYIDFAPAATRLLPRSTFPSWIKAFPIQ